VRLDYIIQTNSLTTLVTVGVSLFLCGCGSWPPIVDSRRDITRLSSTEPSVRARGLPDTDIPALGDLRELRILDFSGGNAVMPARITDEGLARLAELDLPKLQILTLGYCANITDSGLVHLQRMYTVTYLSFMGCPQVTDRGLQHVLPMKSLTGLDLRGCPGITDRGLEILATKTNWQTIHLGGCSNVTAEGVARLQAVAPKARIAKDEKEWSYHHPERANRQ
jgi:hypothetical protein